MGEHRVEVLKDVLGNHFSICSCNWTSRNHRRFTQAADEGEQHAAQAERWEADDDLAHRELDGQFDDMGTCWRCLEPAYGTICSHCMAALEAEQDRLDREFPQGRRAPRMAGW